MFSNRGSWRTLKAGGRFEEWCENRSPGQIAAMRKYMEQMRPKTAKRVDRRL